MPWAGCPRGRPRAPPRSAARAAVAGGAARSFKHERVVARAACPGGTRGRCLPPGDCVAPRGKGLAIAGRVEPGVRRRDARRGQEWHGLTVGQKAFLATAEVAGLDDYERPGRRRRRLAQRNIGAALVLRDDGRACDVSTSNGGGGGINLRRSLRRRVHGHGQRLENCRYRMGLRRRRNRNQLRQRRPSYRHYVSGNRAAAIIGGESLGVAGTTDRLLAGNVGCMSVRGGIAGTIRVVGSPGSTVADHAAAARGSGGMNFFITSLHPGRPDRRGQQRCWACAARLGGGILGGLNGAVVARDPRLAATPRLDRGATPSAARLRSRFLHRGKRRRGAAASTTRTSLPRRHLSGTATLLDVTFSRNRGGLRRRRHLQQRHAPPHERDVCRERADDGYGGCARTGERGPAAGRAASARLPGHTFR